MAQATTHDREALARKRARYLIGLMWHVGTFIIINVFLWLLDLMGPGGINWAYWVTAAWGFGLAFHILAYFADGGQLEERLTRRYLEKQ